MNLPSESQVDTATPVPLGEQQPLPRGSGIIHSQWSLTRKHVFLIWIITSLIAVLACSINLSAAKLKGEYVPVGNDSLYHARRILDTARDPSSFYEFDKKIHAPEGSLLTWPWGYDYALGWVVSTWDSEGRFMSLALLGEPQICFEVVRVSPYLRLLLRTTAKHQ